MNIDIKDIITLDDNNEYVVVSKVNYENKIYYYLVDMNKHENIMFCYEDSEELVELNNKELTTKLMPLFLESSKNVLEEFIQNNN